MSRDEETEEPNAVGEHAVPGDPVDISKRVPSAEASGPSPYHSVVIAADGSAAIDGVPVAAEGGQSVDEAILDALHGHAAHHNRPVTAAISDPAVENVTYVEVAPDGSSRLVEQPSEPVARPGAGTHGDAGADEPLGAGAELDEGFEDGAEYGPEFDGESGDAPGGRATPAPAGAPEPPAPADDDDAYAASDDEAESPLPRPSGWSPPVPRMPVPRMPGLLPRRPKADGAEASRQSDDEYRSSGLLHRPLVVGPVALGVAALVIVPLALLGGGSDDDGHKNKAAGASDELPRSPTSAAPTQAPTVSVSPSLSSPSPSASPKAKPKPEKSKGAGGTKGVTATVTVRPPEATATVTAKPAPDTAATAVKRLAGNDPGRHICYRAYVAGQGWQKSVCDGTVAGTTNQNRAILALNIAVSGTGGTAANAFVHNPGSTDGRGVWKPHWTPNTADGKNIYIGSTRKGAPDMLGFAINIGSGGQICQMAHVHNVGWGKAGCVGPRPEYVFGGTLNNDLWLEAVKFTV